jgi:AcrR family transcriptional regulator
MTEVPTRDRIEQCALEEIEKNGIVGMRVADVASSAGVSVPLIYKYFRDRDGLLAEVLSGTTTRIFMNDISLMRELVESQMTPVTAEQLANLMPMPNDERRKRNRRIRAMAIAASYDIPKLADAIAANQRLMNEATHDLITVVRKSAGCSSPVSTNAVTIVLQALGFGIIIADHALEPMITDTEYRALLVDIIDRLVIK